MIWSFISHKILRLNRRYRNSTVLFTNLDASPVIGSLRGDEPRLFFVGKLKDAVNGPDVMYTFIRKGDYLNQKR